jgi:tetratricopeptide (TPR) repeat protein
MGDATKQSLTRVIEHFQVGRLKEAESVCKQILQVNPNQADALHFLGLVFHEWGQEEQALELIDRALRFVQTDFLYSNRGIVLRAMQRFEEAKHSYQRALAMND